MAKNKKNGKWCLSNMNQWFGGTLFSDIFGEAWKLENMTKVNGKTWLNMLSQWVWPKWLASKGYSWIFMADTALRYPDIYGGYQKILSEVRPRLAEMMNANSSDVALWLQEDCNQFLFSSFPHNFLGTTDDAPYGTGTPHGRSRSVDLWVVISYIYNLYNIYCKLLILAIFGTGFGYMFSFEAVPGFNDWWN